MKYALSDSDVFLAILFSKFNILFIVSRLNVIFSPDEFPLS